MAVVRRFPLYFAAAGGFEKPAASSPRRGRLTWFSSSPGAGGSAADYVGHRGRGGFIAAYWRDLPLLGIGDSVPKSLCWLHSSGDKIRDDDG
ncbi:hypothetical protein TNCV_594901 [Trichonephila clavipes]|nr:hypothetical protein TNCV_594901 [Trichonephila clavipes]